ncbi:MAG: hypothetical protein HY291_09920 [Planctomycetes bacterium]|nr:hypothetical protein [Planctomycetota bacterium]
MRDSYFNTTALVLLALAAAARVQAEDAIPQPAEWPGPLVEVTLHEPAGKKYTGFMLSYQDGRMQFRPLDGQSDQEWRAPAVEELRFLPPPPAKPVAPPPADVKSSTPAESKSASAGNGESKTEAGSPDTRPLLGPRVRDKLDKMREFAEPSGMEKLTPAEKERYRELTIRHPGKHTPEEIRELNGMREKMDLPNFEIYRRAHNEVLLAKESGKLDPFIEGLRKELKVTKDFEEARRRIITILFGMAAKDDRPGEFVLNLRSNMDDEIARIADLATREKVRANKSDIMLDIAGQYMRMEKMERDKPDRDPPLKGMLRKSD